MSFRIRADESPEQALHRAAREQIDRAVAELGDGDSAPHGAVHAVRKRCKKLRGLVRLVRPALGEDVARRENAAYRDAARSLSGLRDAHVRIETLDGLVARFARPLEPDAFAAVRRALVDLRERRVADGFDLGRRLDDVLECLLRGRERVSAWRLDADGFDAFEAGLEKAYRRGREAMAAACDEPSAERFHAWRKRAKDHGHHVRWLRDLWSEPMRARAGETDELSDLLGDEHDLAILRGTLAELPGALGRDATTRALDGLARERQLELRARVRLLGARLYAEKPAHLARRVRAYWRAWRRGAEPTALGDAGPERASA